MKIWVISYLTPPFDGVGSVRVTKLCKYLRLNGFEILTFTAAVQNYETYTEGSKLEKELYDNSSVVRINRFPRLFGLREDGLFWAIPLLFTIIVQLFKERPAIIYTDGGPFGHWAIFPIVRLLGIKYILDYRDPWTESPYVSRPGYLNRIIKNFYRFIEYFAVRNAYMIINVTQEANDLFLSGFGQKFAKRTLVVENGFDPDDFAHILPTVIANRNIVYTGKFGKFRDVSPFFQALKDYNLRHQDQQVKLLIVGEPEAHIVYLVDSLELNDTIIFIGKVAYPDALEHINQAWKTLIISGWHPYEPTTKVYDYMALNKEIIAIINSKTGYLRRIATSSNFRVSSNAKICSDIDELLCDSSSRHSKLKKRSRDYGSYTRAYQFRKLVNAIQR